MSSDGIPDGNASPKVVIDHRAFADVTVGSSGGFQIRMQPVPNLPTLIQPLAKDNSDRTFAVNGLTIPTGAVTFGQDFWTTFISPPEWAPYNATNPLGAAAGDGTAPEIANPYNAVKFRIVSCALRIIYTGTSMNASGVIVVHRNRATYTYGGGLNQSTVSGFYSSSGTIVPLGPYAARNFFVSRYDLNDSSTIIDRTTQTFRPEVSVLALMTRSSDSYQHYPLYPVKVLPLDTATYKPVISSLFNNSPTFSNVPAFVGYDDDWENTIVMITGAQAGTSFRVELNLCVEYVPAQNSTFQALAKPSKLAKAPALKTAEKKIAQVPAGSVASGSNPQRR